MELSHASHCVYKIRYHMVFCIKYRKDMLLDYSRISYFKNICLEIGKRYWFVFDALGSDGNHVHVFVGAAPRYSPSHVMQVMKSITAREIFKQYPEIKEKLWGGEFWSDGGYIATVGEGVTEEIIRRYIEKQGTEEEKEGYRQMKLIAFN